jgi:hypothetical protein
MRHHSRVRNEDVYRLAREMWGRWLKSGGFVRTGSRTTNLVKAGLWVRLLEPPLGGTNRLLICVEANRYGWSPQMGGSFRVLLGAGRSGRDWPGLTRDQRAEMKRMNHSVLDRLDPDFEPVATMRRNVDVSAPGDVWFHFLDESDVRRWLDLLGGQVPTVLAHLAGDRSIEDLFPDRP